MDHQSAAVLRHSGYSEDDGGSVTAPRHEDNPIDLEAAAEGEFAERTTDCNLGGEVHLERITSAGVGAIDTLLLRWQ